MDQDLASVKQKYSQQISRLDNAADLEKIRIELFGRHGLFNQLFAKI
jgi:hypothetical protein